GFAKAAELNHYPGPRHVLDLARPLDLSAAQIAEVTAIRDRMSNASRRLGAELIEREALLDRLFAGNEISPARLAEATAAIGDTQARLRAAHLLAHLETRAVLSLEQTTRYDMLRGYAESRTGKPEHGQPPGHRH